MGPLPPLDIPIHALFVYTTYLSVSNFSFAEPWIQKLGNWMRPVLSQPSNKAEWLLNVIHNPEIHQTAAFKARLSSADAKQQTFNINPENLFEAKDLGPLKGHTFKITLHPSEIHFEEDKFYTKWIDIRTWIDAGKLTPYKSNKKKTMSTKVLNSHFSAERRVLSMRFELSVPPDQHQGVDLHLRAIHMDPDEAEARGKVADNVVSMPVDRISLKTMTVLPISNIHPFTFPFYPVIISDTALTKAGVYIYKSYQHVLPFFHDYFIPHVN